MSGARSKRLSWVKMFFALRVRFPLTKYGSSNWAKLFAVLSNNSTVCLALLPWLWAQLVPNYSFNATVTCRADNPAPSAAR